LSNWVSQDENNSLDDALENFDTSTDLTAATGSDSIMMVACYGDGEDTSSVTITGWTTGPNNYIKIFTPVSSSEVGTSQRHDGKWNTSAYRISNDTSNNETIYVREQYVRIDGLQVDSVNYLGTGWLTGIDVNDDGSDAAMEVHISNCVIRMTYSGTPEAGYGITALNNFVGTNSDYVSKIWNNIIYGYTGSGDWGGSIHAEDNGTVYAYNNTCVGGNRGIVTLSDPDFIAKNNISIDASDPYYAGASFHADSTDNVSDTGDAPGSNPVNGEPTFVNKAGNDYHLDGSDTVALGDGADLDQDANLPVTDDIDGGARDASAPDIGADEYASGGCTLGFRSASPAVTALSDGVSVAMPAGTVEDDIMVFAATSWNDVALSFPAGWTIFHESFDHNVRVTLAWKRAEVGESGPYAVTRTGGGKIIAAIASFSGAITTGSPIDAGPQHQHTSGGATTTAPSITTTVDGAMVVMTSHVDNDRTHSGWGCATDPLSLIEGFDYMDSTVAVALAYARKSSAGSTGDGTATLSSAEDNDGILFAIKPCGSNASPTLTVNDPDGSSDTVTEGDNYNINYDLADTDDTVTVAFYYDSDSSGLDGTAITGACATAAEGTGVTCTWDTTGMTPGSYYVYGVTNDGTNPQVSDYSSGQITINAASSAALDQAHYRWRNDEIRPIIAGAMMTGVRAQAHRLMLLTSRTMVRDQYRIPMMRILMPAQPARIMELQPNLSSMEMDPTTTRY
jgi:hypothetical protein